jgi:peptidoglycan hydrolase CwlO-like protein
MKPRVAAIVIVAIILVGSFCIADSTSSSSDSDAVAALRKELQQTQAQLDHLTTRTTWLEQKVRALEQSNAELQREIRTLQPRWSESGTNRVPHLTPLQSK